MRIVVMGVSGSGKSTVGEALAARLGLPFVEGDALHPKANVEKMSAGIPLDDDDRWPWLDVIGRRLAEAEGGLVVSCSALRRAYRDRLRAAAGGPLHFIFLDGDFSRIHAQMRARSGHFMQASMLESQMATLESPVGEPLTLRADVAEPVSRIVDEAVVWLAG